MTEEVWSHILHAPAVITMYNWIIAMLNHFADFPKDVR